MTLTLALPPKLGSRLEQEAQRRGLNLEAYALELLERNAADLDRRAEAVAMLKEWADDPDEAGQKETAEFLIKALDEDRTSARKLFPPEMKGITW